MKIDFTKVITKAKKEEFKKQESLKKESDEAKKYLNDTDWYMLREFETGVPIPDSIKKERQKAREKVK